MHGINITIKEENKRLQSTIEKNVDLIKLEARNKYCNLSEKEKNKKRKYQKERYYMNTDSNERLKQYQRNYYASRNK